jgi:hypothetical protein
MSILAIMGCYPKVQPSVQHFGKLGERLRFCWIFQRPLPFGPTFRAEAICSILLKIYCDGNFPNISRGFTL